MPGSADKYRSPWSTRIFFGDKKPEFIKTKEGSLLLTSGYWGLARHFNYIGDLTMCIGCFGSQQGETETILYARGVEPGFKNVHTVHYGQLRLRGGPLLVTIRSRLLFGSPSPTAPRK